MLKGLHQVSKYRYLRGIFFILALLLGQKSLAQSGPSTINVSGSLFDSNGAAVTAASVNFRLEVFDKTGSCLLYSENHNGQDLSNTKGGFSLELGAGQTPVNYVDSTKPNVISSKVYENFGAVAGGWAGCPSSVTLANGDNRLIRVHYDFGGGMTRMTPDVPVTSAAYSMVAETLQGKRPSDFIQVHNDVTNKLTQANVENIFSSTNYPKLTDLLSGASTSYISSNPTSAVSFNNQLLTNVAPPVATTDATNKGYVDGNIGGKTADLSGVGPATGDGYTLIWDKATQTWTTGIPTSTDNTKLPLAGGTMSGAIDMAGFDVLNTGHLVMSPLKTLTLGTFNNAQEATLVATLTASNAGTSWYNSQSKTFKIWDGTTATSQSINGIAAGGDLTGTYPNPTIANDKILSAMIDSAGAGINRLVISDQTDGGSLEFATCNTNEVLRWEDANGWVCRNPSSIVSFPVTSVNGKTGAVVLDANDLNLGTAALENVGTAAGEIPVLDAGGKIPSSMIPASSAPSWGDIVNGAGKYMTYKPNDTACGTGEFLKFDGTKWICADISTLGTGDFMKDGSAAMTGNLKLGANYISNDGGASEGLAFDTSGNANFTGNVGIGTTNPLWTLDVAGGVHSSTRFTGVGLSAVAPSTFAPLTTQNTGGATDEKFWDLYHSGTALSIRALDDAYSASNTALQFNRSGYTISSTVFPNGNVGIGTGTPARLLHVNGPMRITPAALPGTPAAGDLAFDSGAANALKFYDGSAWQTVGTGSGSGDFMKDGSVAMTGNLKLGANYISNDGGASEGLAFDTSGNANFTGSLGIGTASPAYPLDVAGNARAQGYFVNANDAGIYWGSNDKITGHAGTHLIALTTNGVERLRVNSSGNVGIGTTSPTRLLDVAGPIHVKPSALPSTPTAGELAFDSGAANALKYYDGSAWQTVGTGSGSGTVTQVDTGTGLTGGPITATGTISLAPIATNTLLANTTASSAAPSATTLSNLIDKAIGNTQGAILYRDTDANGWKILAPGTSGQYLQTQGATANPKWASTSLASTDVNSFAFVQNGNSFGADAVLGTSDNRKLILKANNTAAMTVDTSGNIGIGTGSPAVKLQVAGDAIVDNSMVANLMYVSQGDASSPSYSFGVSNTTGFFLPGYDTIGVSIAGTEKMRIDSTGNVGIGTTAPTRLLDVAGPIHIRPATLPSTPTAGDLAFDSGAANALKFYDGSAWQTVGTGTGSGDFKKDGSVAMTGNFDAGTHDLLNIGNVAIGTTTATKPLTVVGSTAITNGSFSMVGDDNWYSSYFQISSDTGKYPNLILRKTRGTPAAATYVQSGDTIGQISFRDHTHDSGSGIAGTATELHTSSVSGQDLQFFTTTNGTSTQTTRMVIAHDGKVGIGTTTPTRLLDVAGPIHITPAALPSTPAPGEIAFDSGASNALKFYDGSAWQTVGTGGGSGDFKKDGSVAMTGNFDAGSHDLLNVGKIAIGTTTPEAVLDLGPYQNGWTGDAVMKIQSENKTLKVTTNSDRLVFANSTDDISIIALRPEGGLEVAGADLWKGKLAVADGIIVTGPGAFTSLYSNDNSPATLQLYTSPDDSHTPLSAETTIFRLKADGESAGGGATGGLAEFVTEGAWTASAFPTRFAISTAGTSGAPAERLRVSSSGNVGIGTTTPSAKLEVAGNIQISGTGNGIKFPDGTTQTTAASGGGGLTNLTEAVNSTAPNATVPVVSLSVNNAATNVDLALSPKGTGSLSAKAADGTATGGNKRGVKAVDWQISRFAATQVASGQAATIGGGSQNTASGSSSTIAGGYKNTAGGYDAVIAGGENNKANGSYTTISGGWYNTASGNGSTIGGGYGQTASAGQTTIAGGYQNTASAQQATVGGGQDNNATGEFSTVPGGGTVTASGDYSFATNNTTTAESYAQSTFGAFNSPAGTETAGSWVATDPLFVIGNGTASTAKSNALMVLKNGNVGIGSSAPAEKLVVAGNIKMTGAGNGITFPDGTSQTTAATASQWTNGTSSAIYYNAGNVGIGTTTPSRLLQVAGPMKMTPTTTPASPTAGDMFVDSAASNALKFYNGSAWVDMTSTSNQWTTSGSIIYANNGGNVGIGTSNPSAKLTLQTAPGGGFLMLGGNDPSAPVSAPYQSAPVASGFSNTPLYSYWYQDTTGISNPAINTTAFVADGTEAMRITALAKIGIGTTTPSEILEVTGNIKMSGAGNGIKFPDGTTQTTAATGGGLTNFTEAVDSAGINATVPVVSLTVNNGAAGVDLALSPKFNGALSAHVATGSTTGGNKRGLYSTDWQRYRTVATQVASNSYATIGGGASNTASDMHATVAGGNGNTASGSASAVVGGTSNKATANNAFAGGGANNTASGNYSAIIAGSTNTASGTYSTITGGLSNTAAGSYALANNLSTTADSYAQTTFGAYNSPKGSETAASWVATDPLFVVGNGTGSGAKSNALMILKNGSVGIGSTSPRTKLDVNGAVISTAAVSNTAPATTAVDFLTGNIQYTSVTCATGWKLNNLKDGGTYTLIVKSTTSGTCGFSAYSDAGTTALTVHMPPDHAATTSGKHTIYTFLVAGADIYVSWVPGY